jgi:hypothetical protein
MVVVVDVVLDYSCVVKNGQQQGEKDIYIVTRRKYWTTPSYSSHCERAIMLEVYLQHIVQLFHFIMNIPLILIL